MAGSQMLALKSWKAMATRIWGVNWGIVAVSLWGIFVLSVLIAAYYVLLTNMVR